MMKGDTMQLQLERLRNEAGYSKREDFAKHIGIGARQIKAWECGERRLRLEDACKLADFLNCTLDELAGREVPTPKVFTDKRQERMNHCYSMLNAKAKSN